MSQYLEVWKENKLWIKQLVLRCNVDFIRYLYYYKIRKDDNMYSLLSLTRSRKDNGIYIIIVSMTFAAYTCI